jgi:colicin import membrane protein
MIEDVNPPLAFRMIEAAKLIDWEGTLPNPEIDLLLKSIGEKVGRPPVTKMEEEQQLNIVKEKEKALKEEEERKTREKQVEKEHDSELREKETEEAQFLAQKEAGRLEQERREQEARQNELSALYSKGKEALAAQDWQTAIKLFKDILAIDATYKDGSARLKQAEQQLNIDKEKEKALKEEDERKSREKQLENERRDIEAREKAAKEAQLKAQEMANRVTILELEQERLQRQREEERTQREEKGLITKEKQELKSGERKQGTHYKNILVALIVIGIVGIILWATIIIMPLSLR